MNHADPVILAIDPGTEKLGISLIKGSLTETTLISAWYITISPDDLEFRYKAIFRAICDTLSSIKIPIDYYSIETPFFSRNIATTIKLGTTRGIIMACIYRRNRHAKIIDINPIEVRNHFGLKKGAKKPECHELLYKIFRTTIKKGQLHEDALDSIGIGLAALSKIRLIIKQNESKNIRTKDIGRKRRTIKSS